MTPRVGLASIGLLGCCLIGCGLRTDPDYTPVCVDSADGVADSGGTDETAGTDDGDEGGSGEARAGSCQNPIDLPSGEPIVVRGQLGGCSGTEGWCGGSGGEDVYRIGSVTSDVFIDFRPQETEFNPVLRVVREDPCEPGTVEASEVCADIVNSIPGRGFYDQGGEGDVYYIIVDTELGQSGAYAFDLRFGEEASQDECMSFLEEQAIELDVGGQFLWEDALEEDQGRLDSGCSAPGAELVFPVYLDQDGTLEAEVTSLEAEEEGFEPIVSIRTACGTPTEMSCGSTAVAGFGGATTALLVVDQLGVTGGRFSLDVRFQ
ncbi:hypothetical protein [Pseudenhygromyxa sp. WMMC2535]|uniref:hypothetical protein n=1 Tax=Pseudenhygromyxa sp. WMMC2535 TaxID=2712867 RepID=UPI001556ABE7|nr:hypothetical protein [Pseudenhygromyxa sp. WMMC2535]